MLCCSRKLVTPLGCALTEKCYRKCFRMCSYRFIGLKASQNQQLQKKRGSPFLCVLPRFDAKMVFVDMVWRRRNSSGTISKQWMLMHHTGDP